LKLGTTEVRKGDRTEFGDGGRTVVAGRTTTGRGGVLSETEAVHFEYHIPLFAYLLKNREAELLRLREEPTRTIILTNLSLLQHRSPYTDLAALSIIKALQSRLERELQNLIEGKGIYYWFHLYRRFAPGSNFDCDSLRTIALYREITESAFLKYGAAECGAELVQLEEKGKIAPASIASGLYVEALKDIGLKPPFLHLAPSVYLGEFDFSNLVELCQIERLAYEYWKTTACLRRLHKGGVLHVEEEHYFVVNTASTEKLIDAYDRRGSPLCDMTTTSGVMMHPENMLGGGISLCPQYNLERITEETCPQHRVFGSSVPESLAANFLWVPVDFDYYYRQHQFCHEQFEQMHGVSLASFVHTLLLVCRQAIANSRFRNGIPGVGLMQRAYQYMGSIEDYEKELVWLSTHEGMRLPSSGTQALDARQLSSVLQSVTLDIQRRSSINLTTRGPRVLLFPARENKLVVDYAAILPILSTYTHFLTDQVEGKGHLFEDSLKRRLEARELELWAFRRLLKHADGSSREIDLAFIVGNALIICELKSISRSFAFEIGETQALEFRKNKLVSALDEVDEKVRWLEGRKRGVNYEIPGSVVLLVPIVISPFCEYLWSTDMSLWATEDIPRVCIPSELERLLDEDHLKDTLSRPFVRHVL
jgi:hypothetical protein